MPHKQFYQCVKRDGKLKRENKKGLQDSLKPILSFFFFSFYTQHQTTWKRKAHLRLLWCSAPFLSSYSYFTACLLTYFCWYAKESPAPTHIVVICDFSRTTGFRSYEIVLSDLCGGGGGQEVVTANVGYSFKKKYIYVFRIKFAQHNVSSLPVFCTHYVARALSYISVEVHDVEMLYQ